MSEKIVIPDSPPFGLMVLFGVKAAGKTLASINSPWEPVHVIDVEGSSADYFKEQRRLVDSGVLAHGFTRADCMTADSFAQEVSRIKRDPAAVYGTLVIDTGGQWAEWTRDDQFKTDRNIADKQSQIVWGRIRSRLRDTTLALQSKCKLMIITAHERDYRGVKTPRVNPAIMELVALSFRLVRDPNKALPDAHLNGSRLPFFPPRIVGFTVANLLRYFDTPADWGNLDQSELQPEMVLEDRVNNEDYEG